MYPTGGYGNFFYYLLAEHLDSTVKIPPATWRFKNGNSHAYPKHTEKFSLGYATQQKSLKNFCYDYKITIESVADQIAQGKKFLVLADMGNKGDNVKFLRRYFPRAIILRVFAASFLEKLIVWTNCMLKSEDTLRNSLYPGAILTAEGIAAWTGKLVQNITDDDAVNCMVHFFQSDFDDYGKMFSQPLPDVINVPAGSFFTQGSIHDLMITMAERLDTKCVSTDQMAAVITNFIGQQQALSLLQPGDSFPLIRKAMERL